MSNERSNIANLFIGIIIVIGIVIIIGAILTFLLIGLNI